MRRFSTSVCLGALLLVGCGEPPNREVDRAQGAIDAARAAGAGQYATSEYEAATSALESAHTAIAALDYRLALNYALESHEHAENAARETADTKAKVRADVELALMSIDALMAKAREQLETAELERVPRKALMGPDAELSTAASALQEARTAAKDGEYLTAKPALDAIQPRVEQVIADVEAAIAAQPARRRR